MVCFVSYIGFYLFLLVYIGLYWFIWIFIGLSKTFAACHRRTPRESAKGACTFTFPGPGAASEAETEAEKMPKVMGR